MDLHQAITNNDNFEFNKNKKFINLENIEKFSYLYPNGHRITHQMRWLKYSRDIVSSENIVT